MSEINKFSSISRWKQSRRVNKHICALNLGSESMLPKELKVRTLRNFMKLALVSPYHPEAKKLFVSYPAILAERQRNVYEAGGRWIIHPYSWISLIWNTIMIVINLTHMLLVPVRLCYIFDKESVPKYHIFDHVIFVACIIIFFDIILKFRMGYKKGDLNVIVMTPQRIVCNYLMRWFIIDLISCLPITYIMIGLKLKYIYLLAPQLLQSLRCLKIFSVLGDIKVFTNFCFPTYIGESFVSLIVHFMVSMHWCACIIYLAPVSNFYILGSFIPGYCSFLDKTLDGDLTEIDAETRYTKGIFICVSAFFGTGFSMFQAKFADEIFLDSLIILYTSLVMVYIIVVFMKVYMTKFNSIMQYHELMNQMEKYMRQKQFSTQLRKRVRDFYTYRYQQRYYKEDAALACLSEQLRNEISLHTCHNLINKVTLFEGLPATLVGTVLGCLKPEVFMPNDLMLRAGDIGDCMYFIATGTVAVYSLKGAEICHLEDGAHFGEIALLMKDSKRIATVVAIEITQVYRLDDADFRTFVMSYQELYQRVEAMASKRMHETVLTDEAYRQMKNTL